MRDSLAKCWMVTERTASTSSCAILLEIQFETNWLTRVYQGQCVDNVLCTHIDPSTRALSRSVAPACGDETGAWTQQDVVADKV
jgi:hypothetical protein